MRHRLFHHTRRWYIKVVEHEFTPIVFCLLISIVLLVGVFHVRWYQDTPSESIQFASASQSIPYEPVIIQNVGQVEDADILFYISYGEQDILFYKDAIVYQVLQDNTVEQYVQRYANAQTREIRGQVTSDMVVRQYTSTVATSTLPTYESIVYRELYPGIDLEVTLAGEGIKFAYVVSPGANPDAIAMEFSDSIEMRLDGGLILGGVVPIDPPVSYQLGVEIDTDFMRVATNTIQFRLLESVDPTEPYVIDPYVDFLTHGTFFGGTGQDGRTYLAIDEDTGIIYGVGELRSRPYDPTPGTYGDENSSTGWDHAVVKFSPQLDTIDAITYIGGDESNQIRGMVYDQESDVLYIGGTATGDFPITPGAVDSEYSVDPDGSMFSNNEIGIARVLSDLSLDAATLLGGSDRDVLEGLALDEDGSLLVFGSTISQDFATTSDAFVGTHPSPGAEAGFVTRLSPSLTQIEASTLFGGSGNSSIKGVVDYDGQYYVGAMVANTDYAATNTVFTTTVGGSGDIVIFALPSTFATPTAMMRLGGAGTDNLSGMSLINDTLYIYGTSPAPGLSASTEDSLVFADGYQSIAETNAASFVMTLASDLSSITGGTYLDGSGSEGIFAITSCGEAIVYGGYTNSTDYPESNTGYQTTFSGGIFDGIVGILTSDLTTLTQSTYIGGTDIELVRSVTCDAAGTIYASGGTKSNSFSFDDGVQSTNAGDYDWFITRYFTSPPTLSITTTSTLAQDSDGTVIIPIRYYDATEETSLLLTYTTSTCSSDLTLASFVTSTIAADSEVSGTIDTTASAGFHVTESGTPGVTSTASLTWDPAEDLSFDGTLCLAVTVSDGASTVTSYASSTVDTLAPTIPGDISLLSTSTDGITIQFSSSSVDSHFDTYRLYYAVGTSTLYSFVDVPYLDSDDVALFASSTYSAATSTFVSLPNANAMYTVRLVAVDTFGNMSSGTPAVTAVLPPVIPDTVSADNVGTEALTLSWDGGTNATSTWYQLTYLPPTTTLSTTTEMGATLTGLTCNTPYTIVLATYDIQYRVASTSEHVVSTAACPTPSSGGGGGGGAYLPPTEIDVSAVFATILGAIDGQVTEQPITISVSGVPDQITEIAMSTAANFDAAGWQPINRETEQYLFTLPEIAGEQRVYIKLRTSDGTTAELAPLLVAYTGATQTLSIDPPAMPTVVLPERINAYQPFRVTGVGLPQAEITVTVGSVAYRINANTSGNYTVDVLSQLAPGTYSLSVRQRRDVGGPQSEPYVSTIVVQEPPVAEAMPEVPVEESREDLPTEGTTTSPTTSVSDVATTPAGEGTLNTIPPSNELTETEPETPVRPGDISVPSGNTPFFLLYDSTNANYRRDQVSDVTMLPQYGIDVYVRPATSTKSITARIYSRTVDPVSSNQSVSFLKRLQQFFFPTVVAQTDDTDRTMVQGYLFEKDSVIDAYSETISLPEDTLPGTYDLVVTINEASGGKTHIETRVVVPPTGQVRSSRTNESLETARVQLYQVLDDAQLALWRDPLQVQKNPQFVDSAGRYAFKLPEGAYVMVVDAPGYTSFRSEPLELTETQIVSQDVVLTAQHGAWEWFWNMVRRLFGSV